MKKIIYLLLILATGYCPCLAYAKTSTASAMPVGRYVTVASQPQAAQKALLTQLIQVRFPHSVQTIGEAMEYLLRLSGYSLVPAAQRSEALNITLSKPLPAVDRDFGPMSLQEALTTLAGPAFYLAQNPLQRTVNFILKPSYAHFTHAGKAHPVKKRGE